MLYGLGTLARDLERARQEQYRNLIRAAGAEDQQAAAAAAKAVKKLPGIGERQPSKDALELALIRCAFFPRLASQSARQVPLEVHRAVLTLVGGSDRAQASDADSLHAR